MSSIIDTLINYPIRTAGSFFLCMGFLSAYFSDNQKVSDVLLPIFLGSGVVFLLSIIWSI